MRVISHSTRNKVADTTGLVAEVRPDGRVVWHAESGAYSNVPVWTGATAWLDLVATHPQLVACAARRKVAVDVVLLVADIKAQAADSTTGRHVTLSLDQLAEATARSRTTVRRARNVLADLGLAQLVRRGAHMTAAQRFDALALDRAGLRSLADEWALTQPVDQIVRQPDRPRLLHRQRATPPVGWLRELHSCGCVDGNYPHQPAPPRKKTQRNKPRRGARSAPSRPAVQALVTGLWKRYGRELAAIGFRRTAHNVQRLALRGIGPDQLVDALDRWSAAEGFAIEVARTPGYLAWLIRQVELTYLAVSWPEPSSADAERIVEMPGGRSVHGGARESVRRPGRVSTGPDTCDDCSSGVVWVPSSSGAMLCLNRSETDASAVPVGDRYAIVRGRGAVAFEDLHRPPSRCLSLHRCGSAAESQGRAGNAVLVG